MSGLVVVRETYNPLALHQSEPELKIHRDCVYVPIMAPPANFWENPFWGVYDADGRLIDAATFYRQGGMGREGQNPTCLLDVSNAPYAPLRRYFYVGNIIPHYGHFLCSSMARLWALPRHGFDSLPLIGHNLSPPPDWFAQPFVGTLFGAAGVGMRDFAGFQTPVRVRELVVAGPSFVELNRVHAIHAKAAHSWGDRLVRGQDVSTPIDMVYMSKSRFGVNPNGLGNEAPLVAELERLGVPIVYPEQLPIPEQVALFRRSRVIMGQVGSAFHTSVLSETRPDQVFIHLLHGPDHYSCNHALTDMVNGNRSFYVYSKGEWRPRPGFNDGFELADPVAAARDLLDFAHSVKVPASPAKRRPSGERLAKVLGLARS